MALAKKLGQHVGRPPKTLSTGEWALAEKMRGEGAGWKSIALAVSKARGAFEIADPRRRRQLEVSHTHIRRALVGKTGTSGLTKPAT